VIENRKRLNALKEQLAEIDSELPLAEALMRKSQRIVELEADIEAGKRQYANCERAKELRTELERLERVEGVRYPHTYRGSEKASVRRPELRANV